MTALIQPLVLTPSSNLPVESEGYQGQQEHYHDFGVVHRLIPRPRHEHGSPLPVLPLDQKEPLNVLAGSRAPVFGPWVAAERMKQAWERYLTELEQRARFSGELVSLVRDVWQRLLVVVGKNLPAPQAGPTSEGGLLLAWSLGKHYFEIEFLSDGRQDWLYRDGLDETVSSGEGVVRCELSSQAAYYLLRMFPGEGG